MDILTLARELKATADLVVTDREGRSLMLVEVQPWADRDAAGLAQLREHQYRFEFPFALLADPDQIQILGPDGTAGPVARMPTLATLTSYRSIHADSRLIAKDDIERPLSRWLYESTSGDLTERHPGFCCLKKAGLAVRMIWGHLLTREMYFEPIGTVEHSF